MGKTLGALSSTTKRKKKINFLKTPILHFYVPGSDLVGFGKAQALVFSSHSQVLLGST
jgi:hypothetical protein